MNKEQIIHDIAIKCLGVFWDENNKPNYDATLESYLNHVEAIRESKFLGKLEKSLRRSQSLV